MRRAGRQRGWWFTVLVVLATSPVRAEDVETLVAQALAARPELVRAQAEVRAARERVPQTQGWADPMLQVGVQNDSFTRWSVGRMETSWISFMASQTFPFPGKNARREAVAERDVQQRIIAAERVRLTTVADVRRAYLALQLALARQRLLERLISLSNAAQANAQLRYETADGPQADVLRAGLEVARLGQRQRALELEAHHQRQALNRLRAHPLTEAVEPAQLLTSLDFPTPPADEQTLAEARTTSPELLTARLAGERAVAERDLAGHLALPDLTVSAGVMLRGALDPMWAVTVGAPLPVFSSARQAHALSEAAATRDAAESDALAVDQLLTLRTQQRLEAWRSLGEQWAAAQQLLAQAEAVTQSALGQYRAGKAPLAAVLEASATHFAEGEAALTLLADAWRLAIATAEVSLEEPR